MDISKLAETVRRYAALPLKFIAAFLQPCSFGLLFAAIVVFSLRANAGQFDIFGPSGSVQFGSSVTLLPNGNFVVTDPNYGPGNVGAVFLYDGSTLALLSSITGPHENDHVGSGGIIVLSNGNFLVNSTNWNNGSGAVTWVSGTSGLTGQVSSANSLVGISTNGSRYSITLLINGNYVVNSPYWNNSAGAATWANGLTGVTGTVSQANSLVGNTSGDEVGLGVSILSNGNYVVSSPSWNNNVGAATWANGVTGTTGIVSPANSLVGSSSGDQVGDNVTALTNGNYVVGSPEWKNGSAAAAGAATLCNGATGRSGAVSAANSLVGTQANDQVGFGSVPLVNGNYVVLSPNWHNGFFTAVGAATWGNGTTGITGIVSAVNSLVGSQANDDVGAGVAPLNNGNYVVDNLFWSNGSAAGAGAVTWGNGFTGTTGIVSSANSLVGSKSNDQVGYQIAALTNGSYLVISRFWDNGGAADAGAVTWSSGTNGVTGPVSAANSLVGAASGDQIGYLGALLLSNGNYVVASPLWDNGGPAMNVGAVTWGSGTTGVKGAVSAANSLVGTTANDYVGNSVVALNNGNYVVSSPYWHNGSITNAGAATWCSGATGRVGTVSTGNSLIGSTANDYISSDSGSGPDITPLSNGNYVVASPNWHNGSAANAGAATWCSGTAGRVGTVSVGNSLVGGTAGDYAATSVTALTNGNYVVGSPNFHNGPNPNAGAVTWASGVSGRSGTIAANNSLVGGTTGDVFGSSDLIFLSDGNYAVSSPDWDNGAIVDAGEVTWCDGTLGTTGLVSTVNSFLGNLQYGGYSTTATSDPIYKRVLIAYPAANRVSLLGFTPHLVIQQPTNFNLSNGSTRIFGAPVGSSVAMTFTLKNSNLGDLTGLGITIDGADASLFSMTSSVPTSLSGPFGVTNFIVRFTPASTGSKTATLHIASSDTSQNPFNLNLSGKGLSSNEDTDGDGMSDAAEFALAALGFDWQASQPAMVDTFYTNANSAGLYTSNQVQALSVNSPLLARDPQTGLFSLTIGVQRSTNLVDFVPFPLTSSQSSINPQGELEVQFSSPDNAAFFRLESH